MPDGLYDRDVLLWSERQAELLRRLAAGERVNEQVDWANVIEEMEGVGRSELHSCESLLRQAIAHLLKLALLPDSPDVRHWNGEIVTFLADVAGCYTPSMSQRIDLEKQFGKALQVLQRYGVDPQSLLLLKLAGCPFTLAELVVDEPDIDALLLRLSSMLPA